MSCWLLNALTTRMYIGTSMPRDTRPMNATRTRAAEVSVFFHPTSSASSSARLRRKRTVRGQDRSREYQQHGPAYAEADVPLG